MDVVLTGGSSFTGYWFAKTLVETGHRVIAPLRQRLDAYADGARAARVRQLAEIAEVVEETPFGSDRFIALGEGGVDILCHHAAYVNDYRSPDFDVLAALGNNTANLKRILEALKARGLKGIVGTGSVFEQNEGAGGGPLVAFSPYGLSKGLTGEILAYYSQALGLPYGKFVIPNPFGPLEEPRFCAYLVRTWKAGEVAGVKTPDYVRDNIHVTLLARAYARYVADLAAGTAPAKLNPSGYVEAQGRFAQRFAAEMQPRLGLECRVELASQTDFSEPLMRVNTDSAFRYAGAGWSESEAWDEIAQSYR